MHNATKSVEFSFDNIMYQQVNGVAMGNPLGLTLANIFVGFYGFYGRSSQVDYIVVRRQRIKEVVDTKVLLGESVAKHHRIVVSAIIIWTKWKKAPKLVKRIKWWKLKDSKVKNKFKMDVIESGIFSGQEDWQRIAE